MRRVSNKKAVELAEQGRASYDDGTKPKALVSVEDSFNSAKQAIQDLTKQVNKDVSSGNEAILNACDVIIESMNLYHEAVMLTITGLPQPESFDMGEIDKINDRLITILTHVMTDDKPREWKFKVEKDWKGGIDEVIATEVKH